MTTPAYRLDPDFRPSCPFLRCYAGAGVAGNGSCFLGGDPRDPKCPQFEDEDTLLTIMDHVAEQGWIAGKIEWMDFVFGTHQ